MDAVQIAESQAQLAELRKEWEHTYTVRLQIDQMSNRGNILVVCQDKRNRYQCHRYFPIGDTWEISVDRSDCTAEDVIGWLADPKASR